mgnify:CR=1 FL=1
MKTSIPEYVEESHSTGEEFEFDVSSVSYIIHALQNSIYTDKIGAVVREITSNAVDEHIKIYNQNPDATLNPVEVSLESRSFWNSDGKMAFTVRDNGPGLLPQEIRDVFVVFGESTKNDNSFQIGGHGIGCKTPFSYTDQFIVRSVHNGIKYQYLMFLDQPRPQAREIAEPAQTDEPSGLEVVVPVDPDDQTEWIKAVNGYTYYFSQSHDITYKGELSKPELEAELLYEDEDVALYDKDYDLPSGLRHDVLSRDHIVIGEVPYSVPRWCSLNSLSTYSYISVIKCSIDELTPNLPREGIQNLDGSDELLNERYENAVKRIYNTIVPQLSEDPTPEEYRQVLRAERAAQKKTRLRYADFTEKQSKIVKALHSWFNKLVTPQINIQSANKVKVYKTKKSNKSGISRRTKRRRSVRHLLKADYYTRQDRLTDKQVRRLLKYASGKHSITVCLGVRDNVKKMLDKMAVPAVKEVIENVKDSHSVSSDNSKHPLYCYTPYEDSSTQLNVTSQRVKEKTKNAIYGFQKHHEQLAEASVWASVLPQYSKAVRTAKSREDMLHPSATFVEDVTQQERDYVKELFIAARFFRQRDRLLRRFKQTASSPASVTNDYDAKKVMKTVRKLQKFVATVMGMGDKALPEVISLWYQDLNDQASYYKSYARRHGSDEYDEIKVIQGSAKRFLLDFLEYISCIYGTKGHEAMHLWYEHHKYEYGFTLDDAIENPRSMASDLGAFLLDNEPN